MADNKETEVVAEVPEVVEPEITFDLPDKAIDFLSQIIDAYPEEDFQSLRKVIGIGKVVYKDGTLGGQSVTAAVVNTRPYTLMFGKTFMSTQMQTIEDCVYILSHELTHLVLDHFAKDIIEEFKEKELGMRATHIIVDCQVNATVYNSLREEKYLEFIKRYYKQDEMPYCFFRPDGIAPTPELQDLHTKLYSEDGITNKELIDGLMPWFQEQQDKLDDIIEKLLGNHEDLFKDRTGGAGDSDLSDLTEAVANDYLEKKKKDQANKEKEGQGDGEEKPGKKEGGDKESNGKAAGKGGDLRKKQIEQCLDRIDYSRAIARKLKKADQVSPASRIFKAIDHYFPKKPVRTVVPNFHDRRTTALHSVGKMPVFHKASAIGSKTMVPCYLDVSGSQDHVVPHTSAAVSRLKDKIGHVVYCFSTMVAPTAIANLKKGQIETTGGTCFNVVAEHILKNNFRRAVILTDGEAYLNDDLKERLKQKKVDITVGWTVPHPRKDPLEGVARETFFVFGEKDDRGSR